MRNYYSKISITQIFPTDRPCLNGFVYARDAVENAIKSATRPLPIVMSRNNGEEIVVGFTESPPYAVQYDESKNGVRFTIDGYLFYGGTACIVNSQNETGEITDFTVTGIGILRLP